MNTLRRVQTAAEANGQLGQPVTDQQPTELAGLYGDADTGEPVLAYVPVPGGLGELRRAVLRLHMSTTYRAGTGMRNASRTFGMAPRKVIQKRESCRPASLATEQPDVHDALVTTGARCDALFGQLLPEVRAADQQTMGRVLEDWRIADNSLWTSGVVNRTSALPYHRDAANFDTWSAMPVVRRGMAGGHLHIPEYGVTVPCRDGWVLMFNGRRLVHGVTPMTPRTDRAYRYSVVFYALRGMADCATVAEETGRARRARTERERAIARQIAGRA